MNIYKEIEDLVHAYYPEGSQDIIDNGCVRFELDTKNHLMSLMRDISQIEITDDFGSISFAFSFHKGEDESEEDRFFLFIEEW